MPTKKELCKNYPRLKKRSKICLLSSRKTAVFLTMSYFNAFGFRESPFVFFCYILRNSFVLHFF